MGGRSRTGRGRGEGPGRLGRCSEQGWPEHREATTRPCVHRGLCRSPRLSMWQDDLHFRSPHGGASRCACALHCTQVPPVVFHQEDALRECLSRVVGVGKYVRISSGAPGRLAGNGCFQQRRCEICGPPLQSRGQLRTFRGGCFRPLCRGGCRQQPRCGYGGPLQRSRGRHWRHLAFRGEFLARCQRAAGLACGAAGSPTWVPVSKDSCGVWKAAIPTAGAGERR